MGMEVSYTLGLALCQPQRRLLAVLPCRSQSPRFPPSVVPWRAHAFAWLSWPMAVTRRMTDTSYMVEMRE